MDSQVVFCHNPACPASGQSGKGNIGVLSRKDRRYVCHVCGRTFSANKGTAFYRLCTAKEIIVIVITLLAHGCPVQAIVAAFKVDERTVLSWQQSEPGSSANRYMSTWLDSLVIWATCKLTRCGSRSVVDIERRLVQGTMVQVETLLRQTQGEGQINVAFIERLNATFRSRISALVRRGRALVRQSKTLHPAMCLVGTVYNFCSYHKSLRLPLYLPEN